MAKVVLCGLPVVLSVSPYAPPRVYLGAGRTARRV